MMNKTLLNAQRLISLCVLLPSIAFADAFKYESPFKCDGESKWLWYCDEQPEPPKKAPTPVAPKSPEPKEMIISKPKSDDKKEQAEIEAYNKLKKDLEDALKIATMNPTDSNVKRWIELNNQINQQAAIFADVGKRVYWQNPEIDYSQRFPTSDIGKTAQRSELHQRKKQTFADLANQGWGLFFFFKNSCSFCHKQAPVLQFVKQDTGLPIVPVTLDGQSFDAADALGQVMMDQGQAMIMGVKQVPSLVLGNVNTKQLVFISSGLQTAEEIQNRIFVLTSTKPGENF